MVSLILLAYPWLLVLSKIGGAVQLTGGQRLRVLRDALGYTMREVETGSLQVARLLANDEFAIPPSRLSDIETKGWFPVFSTSTHWRRFIDPITGSYCRGMAST